jgi:hypothetical protein
LGKLWDFVSDEKVQKTGTFVLGVLGLLAGAAWSVYVYYNPPPSEPKGQASAAIAFLTPSSTATSTPIGSERLTGAWIGRTGLCHLIVEHGSRLTITNYDIKGGRLGIRGWGTYLEGQVRLYYEINGQKQTVALRLSQDGTSLIGETETETGRESSTWNYVGSSCPQVQDREHE